MELMPTIKDCRASAIVNVAAQLLFALLSLTGSVSAWAGLLSGKVIGVTDGDTITLLDDSKTQHKIRLAGIDAPEKGQPFGQPSKERLSALVFSKHVLIDWQKQDRYGRIVGKVLTEGRDANLDMVASGMAWHYKGYQKEQSPADRIAYAEAENKAQADRRGLWRDPAPVPPWEYRKRNR